METKTISLKLEGLDGNIFSLIGAFSRQAKKEGWTKEERDVVINKCMDSGDYDEALQILMSVCEE